MPSLNPRADWVSILEAIHDPSPDGAWASGIVDAVKPLFPTAQHVVTYAVNYDASRQIVDMPLAAPDFARTMMAGATRLTREGSRVWQAFAFGRPVGTHLGIARSLDRSSAAELRGLRDEQHIVDALGVVAHPRPGLLTVISAIFDHPLVLTRSERGLLTRVAMHLEAGHRLRTEPAAVVAEIDRHGRVDARTRHAAERFGAGAARITAARARARRRDPEATDLWTALEAGHVSILPRGDRYLVLENPPASHRLRALTRSEVGILSLAARGTPTKQIAYALGLSRSQISVLLSSAAAKVGALSRVDLVRLAALLSRDARGLLDDGALTAAEREVLELLERGLDNAQIAAIRMRSVRTIANQVAALLHKTKSASRRALVARAARGRAP